MEASNASWMQDQLDAFWSDWFPEHGIYHTQYNPPPVWNEPVNPELWMPGKGVAEAVVTDVATCTQDTFWGCGNLLDDAALGISAVGAVGCAFATVGGCLGVVGGASTFAGGTGALITTRNAAFGEATWGDAGVSWLTTVTGGVWGGKFGGATGVGIGAIQRIYDWWAGTR
jgi:hypothetical protein